MRRLALLPVFLLLCAALSAQSVTVKDTVMRTYGYSDPDPVPRTGRILPSLPVLCPGGRRPALEDGGPGE